MNTSGRKRRQAIAGYPQIRPAQRPRFAGAAKLVNEKKTSKPGLK